MALYVVEITHACNHTQTHTELLPPFDARAYITDRKAQLAATVCGACAEPPAAPRRRRG